MKFFYKAIFLFLFLSKINFAHTARNVLNTCGLIGYTQPNSPEDCKEKGKMCCFVQITKDNDITSFCVNSPTEIEKKDVENEIKEYTGFTLKRLLCNKSRFLYNSMITALFIIFIIF